MSTQGLRGRVSDLRALKTPGADLSRLGRCVATKLRRRALPSPADLSRAPLPPRPPQPQPPSHGAPTCPVVFPFPEHHIQEHVVLSLASFSKCDVFVIHPLCSIHVQKYILIYCWVVFYCMEICIFCPIHSFWIVSSSCHVHERIIVEGVCFHFSESTPGVGLIGG